MFTNGNCSGSNRERLWFSNEPNFNESLQESDGEFISCKDKDTRKSKCPCLRDNVGCTSDCRCRNCGNIYNSPDDLPGKREADEEASAFKGKAKRRRSNPQVSLND